MMVVSHLATMCIDPGFVPLRYAYKEEVISAPFSSLAEVESELLNRVESPAVPRHQLDEEQGD